MFQWKDAYSCNIAEIDKQHRNLLEIGARLYDIIRNQKDFDYYDDVLAIFNELQDYAVYHFGYEENLMKQYGYEEFEEHKKEHQQFVDKLKEAAKKDIDEELFNISLDLATFIADWIEHHILRSDKKYKDFFNAKGVF
ncbi:MAG TPA: hemerythrin family protein [Clostridiales bacterium]|nr:hemerythrin family protein [Clostridiales bacterium]